MLLGDLLEHILDDALDAALQLLQNGFRWTFVVQQIPAEHGTRQWRSGLAASWTEIIWSYFSLLEPSWSWLSLSWSPCRWSSIKSGEVTQVGNWSCTDTDGALDTNILHICCSVCPHDRRRASVSIKCFAARKLHQQTQGLLFAIISFWSILYAIYTIISYYCFYYFNYFVYIFRTIIFYYFKLSIWTIIFIISLLLFHLFL